VNRQLAPRVPLLDLEPVAPARLRKNFLPCAADREHRRIHRRFGVFWFGKRITACNPFSLWGRAAELGCSATWRCAWTDGKSRSHPIFNATVSALSLSMHEVTSLRKCSVETLITPSSLTLSTTTYRLPSLNGSSNQREIDYHRSRMVRRCQAVSRLRGAPNKSPGGSSDYVHRVLLLTLRTVRHGALVPNQQRGRFGIYLWQHIYCM
jgi:hypothetical protein